MLYRAIQQIVLRTGVVKSLVPGPWSLDRGRERVRGKDGRGELGQSIVEFSLIAIVFFSFVAGIFDSARLFQSWMTVQHSSREAARYAITGQVICTGYTDNRPACITQKAKKATTGLAGGGASSTTVGVATKYWDYPAYAGSGITGAGGQCDQIEVTVTYTHRFVTPLLQAIAPSGIVLKGSQRMTNEPFGQCS